MSAETNSTERCRSHALKIPRFINPLREKSAQANMFAYAGSQSRLPEIAHNHPEFERAEAATERRATIHQIGNLLTGTLRVAQVLRDQAERGCHSFRVACINSAAI